jgi:hypothetical protein
MFLRRKQIFRLLGVGLASVVLVTPYSQRAVAQRRQVSLKSTECLTSYVGAFGGSNSPLNVAVGREILRSSMQVPTYSMMGGAVAGGNMVPKNTSYSLTCQLSGPKSKSRYKSLALSFGRADRSRGQEPRVVVYLDGNEANSVDVVRGKATDMILDVANVKNVEVEVSCPYNSDCAMVYFFKYNLDPGISSPGSRN